MKEGREQVVPRRLKAVLCICVSDFFHEEYFYLFGKSSSSMSVIRAIGYEDPVPWFIYYLCI